MAKQVIRKVGNLVSSFMDENMLNYRCRCKLTLRYAHTRLSLDLKCNLLIRDYPLT